jgi:hypothetical protein
MRDPKRIEPMLDLLKKVWMQSPDLRLSQLIVNAIRQGEPAPQVFYAEDDRVAEGLKAYFDLIQNAEQESQDDHT